jgi:hypothetical protein
MTQIKTTRAARYSRSGDPQTIEQLRGRLNPNHTPPCQGDQAKTARRPNSNAEARAAFRKWRVEMREVLPSAAASAPSAELAHG